MVMGKLTCACRFASEYICSMCPKAKVLGPDEVYNIPTWDMDRGYLVRIRDPYHTNTSTDIALPEDTGEDI